MYGVPARPGETFCGVLSMNAFVYHGQDREGTMLADVIRRFDNEDRFRFLPLETPDALRRLRQFMVVHHGLPPSEPTPLPLVVVVQDTSGQRPHQHRVVHGTSLTRWFQGLPGTSLATVRHGVFWPFDEGRPRSGGGGGDGPTSHRYPPPPGPPVTPPPTHG